MSCKKAIKWYDLFPVLSFILLRGKCRECGKKYPIATIIVELSMAFLVALYFYTFGVAEFERFLQITPQNLIFIMEFLFGLFVLVVLAVVFVVDWKSGLIPNKITYPATLFSIFFLISISAYKSFIFYQDILATPFGRYLMPPYSGYFWDNVARIWMQFAWSALAAVLISLIFVLIILLTRGRGMGWGDVKFVLFLGFALGFPLSLLGVFLGFLIGALFAIILIFASKKKFGQTIPFGPFLSVGAAIALIWGREIINWYLNLSGLLF
jgi:leader peptidase (prepilin peptidase) / N-methyltransferase